MQPANPQARAPCTELSPMMNTTDQDQNTPVLKHGVRRPKSWRFRFLLLASVILSLSTLLGCGALTKTRQTADYAPLPEEGWEVSTPAEQGLDPKLVADLYSRAAEHKTLYGLLIVKNGYLVAERYFNGASRERKAVLASVTKSYVSALAGIALDQGCLSSMDEKMMEFFPEFAGQITDPRKEQITIGQLLKMRSGYPWEENTPPYLEQLFASSKWVPHIVDFPLTSDPGTQFGYSNLTAHLLGVIVARACGTDLITYGEENLFQPIGAQQPTWPTDLSGDDFGSADISFTARDVAKFGLHYPSDGVYEGKQIMPAG